MAKRDWLIVLIMTAVYAVTAFVNLGTTEVPSTQYALEREGQALRIEFEEAQDIRFIKYYAGLGEGTFYFEASGDGGHFSRVAMTDKRKEKQDLDEDAVRHLPRDMYQWNFVEVSFRAKTVDMRVEQAGFKLNELAFCGADGAPVRIASVTSDGDEGADALFDEQRLVQTEHTTYLTDMYFDEVYHARTALEHLELVRPYEITHPPLGKIILGVGIRLFGMNPFGWRFMGTLTGVLLLPLLYILAKRIFKQTVFAFIPAFLFQFDFMHFTQTRIATIDSYSLFFILLMYYFMYRYTQLNFNRDGLKKTLWPLALCGVSFGLGAATKWLCIYAGLGLAVLFFHAMWRRHAEYRAAMHALDGGAGAGTGLYARTVETYWRNLALTLLFCVLVFIVVPVIIYILAYIPYFLTYGDKTAGEALKTVWDNQKYMLNYHGNLKTDKPHPFESRWYTWPLDIRPVFFFQGEHMPEGTVSNISTMGNPLVWWGGFASALFAIVHVIKTKRYRVLRPGLNGQTYAERAAVRGNALGEGLGFIAVAALSQYLPWTLISRETFIYHYFATVPFLILLMTFVLRYIAENLRPKAEWSDGLRFDGRLRCGRQLVAVYLGLVLLLFVAFYPVLSGIVTPAWYANAIRWLPSWPFY